MESLDSSSPWKKYPLNRLALIAFDYTIDKSHNSGLLGELNKEIVCTLKTSHTILPIVDIGPKFAIDAIPMNYSGLKLKGFLVGGDQNVYYDSSDWIGLSDSIEITINLDYVTGPLLDSSCEFMGFAVKHEVLKHIPTDEHGVLKKSDIVACSIYLLLK